MPEKRSRPGLEFWVDVAFCAALFAFAVLVATGGDTPPNRLWGLASTPLVVLPILWRRRAPFGAAVALAAGCVLSGIPTFEQFRLAGAIPAGMAISYSLAASTERRRALEGLALILAGMVFIGFTDVLDDLGGAPAMVLFSFPLCIGTWGAGRLVFSRERLAAELAERSRLLERQREQTAQLAVEVERTRLAADLDLAARSRVRELVELARRGEHALADDPVRAGEAFAWIERAGRDSLNEMRGLLGVLRSDERGERAPRPTLAEIDALLEEARAGGRVVELKLEGERRELPGGIELAAYRALQNALVAIRGTDDEPAVVRLSYRPGALELEVRGFATEGGTAQAAVLAARERVSAYGGTFSASLVAPGRRVLRVQLPLVAAHA